MAQKHAPLAVLFAAIAIAGCGGETTTTVTTTGSAAGSGADGATTGSALPQGSEPVDLDPADFTLEIDNPYWPMTPGSRWTYEEVADGETLDVVVTVTPRTKEIANGIEARVVHDAVSKNGEPLEVTDDYYAQDSAGNIWYLGEDTAEYEDGKVSSRAGSFEAGVDGAQAGIALPGDPQDDMTYRQEYLKGEAEDTAEVLSLDEQAQVPFGHFTGVLMTKDLNPLEPSSLEHKFYARGVGPVLTLDVSGGSGREDLIDYQPGG